MATSGSTDPPLGIICLKRAGSHESQHLFCADPKVLEELRVFDEWSVDILSSESARLFGTKLDREEVGRRYQSALKVQEKTGMSSLRCKVNLLGRNAVRCWDTFCNPRSLPESWRNCKIIPKLHVKGLHVMGRDIGAVIDVTHAVVEELEQHCPFE